MAGFEWRGTSTTEIPPNRREYTMTFFCGPMLHSPGRMANGIVPGSITYVS